MPETTAREMNRMVAGEVRAAMARRGVRGPEMAQVLGIARSSFAERMAGRVPFKYPELVAAADHLGVTLPSLFTAPASCERHQEASA